MVLTSGKYFIKIIFDIKIEIEIFEIPNLPNFNNSSIFNFGTNLVLTGGKYFIKIILDVNIGIGMREKLKVSNFDKF